MKKFYKINLFYVDKNTKGEIHHEFYIIAISFEDACDKSRNLVIEDWDGESGSITSCVFIGAIYL